MGMDESGVKGPQKAFMRKLDVGFFLDRLKASYRDQEEKAKQAFAKLQAEIKKLELQIKIGQPPRYFQSKNEKDLSYHLACMGKLMDEIIFLEDMKAVQNESEAIKNETE